MTDAQILRECARYFDMKARQSEAVSEASTLKFYASSASNLWRIAATLDPPLPATRICPND